MSIDVNDSVLLATTLPTASGQHLGILTLNRPKALNALNLNLIQALRAQLSAWQHDANIVAVWLQGSDKALCAGGDIREVQQYNASASSPEAALKQASDFFQAEYGLYADMANYAKPIVTWCGGIVMGGGLGLAAASSVRIVTETTLMAMPEISIGLFPDAGANWFLQRFPFQSGLFLGLTGSRFNGSDAMLGNLAEFALSSQARESTLAALCQAQWHGSHHEVIAKTLLTQARQSLPPSQILAHQADIVQVVTQATFQQALQQVTLLAPKSAWLQAAADYVAQGCASSAGLHWLLMQRCRYWSLEAVLNLEHTVASHCVTRPDFIEGVRALLIDKDKQPHWHKSVAEVDEAWLMSFLQALPQ